MTNGPSWAISDTLVGIWDMWSATNLLMYSDETPHTMTFCMGRGRLAACVVLWGLPRLLLPGSATATFSYAAEFMVLCVDMTHLSCGRSFWRVGFVTAYTLVRAMGG